MLHKLVPAVLMPLLLSLSGCAAVSAPPAVMTSTPLGSPAIDARIDAIMARMTLEQKIGQIIMPDISAITPDDVRRYGFGSILNGGNSGPGGNERAPAADWLALADAYWDASTAPRSDGAPPIPALWATDAVHGHNNIVGATLFPHNIALGATRDPALVRAIGQATAREIAVTGIDWAFAPTIAVGRDDRWGRTYESYSEDPALVGQLGAALVEGLQGMPGGPGFLGDGHVLATAKHFFGDGGTGGRDQGNTVGALDDVIALHAAPYPPAIDAGVAAVMASFSSVNGEKMHGNHALLTDLLKGRMRFDGLVVGDWNGHGQIPGCSNVDCPQALLAGVDIYMVPEDWRGLYDHLLDQARSGVIPATRLDDAVRRILRVKLAYGLFDRGRPSTRAYAGDVSVLAAPAHRALARQAVRESLVLLSNRNGLLPLDPRRRILVAGPGADDIAMQSGGWTISWQGGGDLTNADFPQGQSIFAGIAAAARAQGGQAILSPDGRFDQRPDVAVVVFGERPYAEFMGDIPNLLLADDAPLALIRRLKAQGIPVVAVLLSGRPLWMNREINAADAFVAAWLPGSEGGGVADVLLRSPASAPQPDFTGRLGFSWPAGCDQTNLNSGDPGYAPLFALGYGLSYRRPAAALPPLNEGCAALGQSDARFLLRAGRALAPYRLSIDADVPAAVAQRARDRRAQEDAQQFRWTAPARVTLLRDGPEPAIAPPAAGRELALLIDYDVASRSAGPVMLSCGSQCSAPFDITSGIALGEGKGWRTAAVPLRCLTGRSTDQAARIDGITIAADAGLSLSLSDIRIADVPIGSACQF